MKLPLNELTIVVTGDFGRARPHDKMKQWTEHNGGIFKREISGKVTHLICSEEEYKKKSPLVLQAKRFKNIMIVSYDWFEDSLMNHRRLPEAPYFLMKRRTIEAADKRALKKAVRKQNIKKGMKLFERGCQDFKEVMGSDGYQIYRFHTSFLYDVTLVRANLLENKNSAYHLKVRTSHVPPIFSTAVFPVPRPRHLYHARVHIINVRAQRLQLYETHSVPRYYACYVGYSEPGYAKTSEVLAPAGSSFEGAMYVFKMFFTLKTGLLWEERMQPNKAGPEAYVYRPPGKGEAVGVLDDGIPERDAAEVESVLRQVTAREWGFTKGEY